MYNKRKIGTQYECLAADYLTKQGYQIITMNYRLRSGEIDIIAKENAYLVFIEVKYRKNDSKGLPQEAVDFRKIRKIVNTAQVYMLKEHISLSTPCRFDVVIVLEDEITLIRNAFDASR